MTYNSITFFLKTGFPALHHTRRMTKTCMDCLVYQWYCPSCQTTSQSIDTLVAHNYREVKKARIEQTKEELIRTRITHDMLLF